MKATWIILLMASLSVVPLAAQMDSHPPRHQEYAEQMRLPFFLFTGEFREVRTTHGGFDVVTANGDRWQIRRWAGRFVAETDTIPRRHIAEYSPYITIAGSWQDFQWRARYADGRTRSIRRDQVRSYSENGGRFTIR